MTGHRQGRVRKTYPRAQGQGTFGGTGAALDNPKFPSRREGESVKAETRHRRARHCESGIKLGGADRSTAERIRAGLKKTGRS